LHKLSVCPDCGSELNYSQWFVEEKLYKLDINGMPYKKAYKSIKQFPYAPECGIICINPECSYTEVPSSRV